MADSNTGGNNLMGLITVLTQVVKAINSTQQTVSKVFPQATGTATSATGGSATLPANPVGFVQVFVPSLNATVKIPYYT